MRAGRLDRKITLQSRTASYDSFNQPTYTWATFKAVWAEVVHASGREFLTSNQTIAERRLVFRIRYLASVTMTMRISYDGDTFDIMDIRHLGRNEGLEIHARAVVE